LLKQIYALCDYETLQKKQISLKKYLEICQKYPISFIQYRDKKSPLDIQKENLIFLKQNTNIPIIINDKFELLDLADGLHFGQEDLDILCEKNNIPKRDLLMKFFKKKYPTKFFGLSTHNEKEILEANNLELDYIGLGAYRTTQTKDVDSIIGDKISYLAKISKHPVGAIGGVRLEDEIENITYYVIGSDLLK
jgi:thiamine-phosphate pyrophosphorylase